LRNNLDEATERLRDTKFQLFAASKEVETLKAEKQNNDVTVTERSRTEAERNEKELRRLRRKIDHLEEERRESDRLQERVAILDAEARSRQDVISSLEGKLATQSEQMRRVESELTRTSSSSKSTDDERKVHFFPISIKTTFSVDYQRD